MRIRNWYISIVLMVAIASIIISAKPLHIPTPYNLAYDAKLGQPYIPADNPLTNEGVWLGRVLFYDKILSGNNTQSCGSCHQQKHSFTDSLAKAIGSEGRTTKRNTMALVNLAWSQKYFWDARHNSLEKAILDPISQKDEMNQDLNELVLELKKHKHYPKLFSEAFPNQNISIELVSKALSQFLRTIVSNGITLPDSLLEIANYKGMQREQLKTENSYKASVYRFTVMCSPCHDGAIYGNTKIANNLLTPKDSNIKAPSMINITLTAPYMHDGRFNNLKEVMLHYQEHIKEVQNQNKAVMDFRVDIDTISNYDINNVLKIFSIFGDKNLTTNTSYSDPFLKHNFDYKVRDIE